MVVSICRLVVCAYMEMMENIDVVVVVVIKGGGW